MRTLEPSDQITAVLALGSNLGQRQDTLSAAISDICAVPEIELIAQSPIIQAKAVGGPEGQGDFLNMVIKISTTLAPYELLAHAQSIEAKHHRVRLERWGPRTLDVDIITYGDLVLDDLELTIPHPRAAIRAFVLYPWHLMDPQATLNGRFVGELAASAADRDGVTLRAQ